MDAKHTPGPWSFFKKELPSRDEFEISGPDFIVCRLDAPANDAEAVEAAEADARLIANSPRMAEALGGAADQFDRWLATPKMVGLTAASLKTLRDEFRALLKEAGL